MGTGDLFPGVKTGWGVTLTIHPHLVLISRMSRSYIFSPLWCLHGVAGQFYFTFTSLNTINGTYCAFILNSTAWQRLHNRPTFSYRTQLSANRRTQLPEGHILGIDSVKFQAQSQLSGLHKIKGLYTKESPRFYHIHFLK
jgi:hypothetical protein